MLKPWGMSLDKLAVDLNMKLYYTLVIATVLKWYESVRGSVKENAASGLLREIFIIIVTY